MGKFALSFDGQKSIVDQSAKDQCDLNKLLRGYNRSQIPPIPVVDDVINLVGVDYSDMLIAVTEARNSFLNLPSNIRSRFKNDPQLLMEFVSDSANYDEAVSLGLIDAKEHGHHHANAPDGESAGKKIEPAKAGESKEPQSGSKKDA